MEDTREGPLRQEVQSGKVRELGLQTLQAVVGHRRPWIQQQGFVDAVSQAASFLDVFI